MTTSNTLLSLLILSSGVASALPADADAKSDTLESSAKAQAVSDFINFKNDDTLHGKFLGLTSSGKIIWKNPSAEKNIAFSPAEVRQVVINKGQLVKPFSHISHVSLTNSDTIPGEITAINDTSVVLTTNFAGKITIPKEKITSIDFQPLGDKILYRGPFLPDGWKIFPYSYNSSNSEELPDSWTFKNFTWQNNGKSGFIIHEKDFGDKARYTFSVNTRNRVMPSLVLAANLEVPEKDDKEDEKNKPTTNRAAKVAEIIGDGLVFRLNSYSSSLSYYGFDEQGNASVQTLPNLVRSSGSRPQVENYHFDVRLDKQAGTVILYSQDHMIGQWDITDYKKELTGSKFGFANLYTSSSNSWFVKDIVVSSWNGVTEPAASMENENRDTLLLTNGTDRFSGKTLKLSDKTLHFKGPYADLAIPTEKIQSLYFAKGQQAEATAKAADAVSIRFYGTGRISGKLSKGPQGKVILESALLGKLEVATDYISSYEFEDMDYAYEIQH